MAYDNKPHVELALQFFNGNRDAVLEALRNEAETRTPMHAAVLALNTYNHLINDGGFKEAVMFVAFMNASIAQ